MFEMLYFHEVTILYLVKMCNQQLVKESEIFQTNKNFITKELERCPTISDNVYFANNEQASLPFTAAFCFAHAEHNLIKLKLYNN